MIKGFNGEHRFLSNFWQSPIEFEGHTYSTVEHAYQAAKTIDVNMRAYILVCPSPADAKRAGRNVVLRPDWDAVKVTIMATLLRKKFYDPLLKAALLQTGDEELIEDNYWHDNFWGKCSCTNCAPLIQLNQLGVLLMEARSALRQAG